MSPQVGFQFPSPLYPIADYDAAPDRDVVRLARAIVAAGAPLLQLRVKSLDTQSFVAVAREVAHICASAGTKLVINDRADIALLVGALGVHLGQEDLSPTEVRPWFGRPRVLGWSTHNLQQALDAERSGHADYIGVGPIFPTRSKANPDPVLGLDGLRAVRAAVRLPIVAIGGVTESNAEEVLKAGADAVAMISSIATANDPQEFIRRLQLRLATRGDQQGRSA